MPDPTDTILAYLRKVGAGLDPDFLREAVRVMSALLMEIEVKQQIGADRYERTEERTTYRNGYRDRAWSTRVGEIPLKIPKLREGSYFPSLLEPRRQAEQALLSVIQEAYIQGVSTRRVDELVKALGLTGIDKSAVSRVSQHLDEVVRHFRERKLETPHPYVWLDALYLKVRQNHRIVSQAVVIAIGVKETGEREIVGFDIGASEEYAFWLAFLRSLVQRGLQGVQLVISDAHTGLKAAIGARQLATVPRALLTQFTCACPTRRQGDGRCSRAHDLCTTRPASGWTATPGSGQSLGSTLAKSREGAVGGRGGCAGVYGLSSRPLGPNLFHESAGTLKP